MRWRRYRTTRSIEAVPHPGPGEPGRGSRSGNCRSGGYIVIAAASKSGGIPKNGAPPRQTSLFLEVKGADGQVPVGE